MNSIQECSKTPRELEVGRTYRIRKGTLLRITKTYLVNYTEDRAIQYDAYCRIEEVHKGWTKIYVWSAEASFKTKLLEPEKLELISLEEGKEVEQWHLNQIWAHKGYNPNIVLPDGRIHVFNPETAEQKHPFVVYIEERRGEKVKRYYVTETGDTFTRKLEEALVLRKVQPAALYVFIRNFRGGKRNLFLEHVPSL